MNLVAKEFVAARDDEDGVLVLSALAGAAQELGDALIVNPYDVDGFADGAGAGDRHAAAEQAHPHARDAPRRRRPQRLQLGVGHPRGAREPVDQAAASTPCAAGRRPRCERSRCILTPCTSRCWRAFASRKLLVALDFDGVLAPHRRRTPEAAQVNRRHQRLARPRGQLYPARGHLRALAQPDLDRAGRRAVRAADRQLRLPVRDRDSGDPQARAQVHEWAAHARLRACTAMHGRDDRGQGLFAGRSLPARAAPGATRARIMDAVHARAGPVDARDAGHFGAAGATDATRARPCRTSARKSLGCDCALYVGDDDTDEDAFASDSPERLIAVRVGRAAQLARAVPAAPSVGGE